MTPADFIKTAHKIYGRKKWKPQLARDLGVDVSTIHRIVKREQVPGPYEVAIRGMWDQRQREIALEKAARRLLPRGYKKRNVAPRRKKTHKPPTRFAALIPEAEEESS